MRRLVDGVQVWKLDGAVRADRHERTEQVPGTVSVIAGELNLLLPMTSSLHMDIEHGKNAFRTPLMPIFTSLWSTAGDEDTG